MKEDIFKMIFIGFMAGILVALLITNIHIAGLEKQSNEILNRVLLIQAEVYDETL